MDYENAYDDGGKRRTTIIAIVVVAVVLAGIGVIVALVLRNRSAAGVSSSSVGNGGATQGAKVPDASFQYQQVSDPAAAVGGTAVNANSPTKGETPQPGVDRLLTDEEKKNYGYPVEWRVRMRTTKGSLGLQTEIIVEDKGNWKLPVGNKEKIEEPASEPAPVAAPTAAPKTQ